MIINGKRYKGLRAYKEKGKETWLYVHHDLAFMARGKYLAYEAYAGLTEETRLPNCSSSVSDQWLRENCTEKSFRKLPPDVQKHLTNYVAE